MNVAQNEQDCSLSQTGSINIRHIEGKGIGYGEGYTTIDGFFTFPGSTLKHNYVPFLDVRGHIFDHGKFAANTGLGVRLLRSHIHTLGAYYDYRSTDHYHYNQVSLNYENLGRKFDWRVNGYLPVGDKYSSWYQPKFASFQGNSLIISDKREFAMWGINAEIGKHFYQKRHFDCYGAIGPYYFGRSDTNAWGGQARLGAIYKKHIQIDVNGSYDTTFKWIGQGQLSIVFPLGPRDKKSNHLCKDTSLRARASQRVERNEIIVVDHKRSRSVAINPATGLPWNIVFVDNTSHSLGTYESPFSTLLAAQTASNPNDVIYVFPGDGTDTGMNAGIQLKSSQRLLGASTPHPFNTTKGAITVPALTIGLPYITSNTAGAVILASNNEVSGLSIEGLAGFGIVGGPVVATDITNVLIGDCKVVADTTFAILLDNNTNLGAVVIANCPVISGATAGIIIQDNLSISTTSITNCVVSGGTDGVFIRNNDNVGTTSITNCVVSGFNTGVDIANNSNIGAISISDSSILGKFNGIVFENLSTPSGVTTSIANCSVMVTDNIAIVIGIDYNSINSGSAVISNCNISAPLGTYGVSFTDTPSVGGTFSLSLANNTITNPPPTTFGYNVVNPPANPASAFQLEFKNITGSANFQNVTLVP